MSGHASAVDSPLEGTKVRRNSPAAIAALIHARGVHFQFGGPIKGKRFAIENDTECFWLYEDEPQRSPQ